MEEMLKIIIKQNYINMYMIQSVLIKQGVDKRTLKKLQKDSGKEADRLLKEIFNEK